MLDSNISQWLNPSIQDIRHPNCKTRKYAGTLPSTSIIIPFHNEGWSTLLRTIHSIINRTPSILLEEIILVDDKSTRPWLGKELGLSSEIIRLLDLAAFI